MGRRPSENHNISTEAEENAAEALIRQQNAGAEFVIGEDEAPEPQPDPQEPEEPENFPELEPKPEEPQPQRSVSENEGGVVVLTRAATYFDCGIRFIKNKPVQILDEEVYEHLLKTGLFVHI